MHAMARAVVGMLLVVGSLTVPGSVQAAGACGINAVGTIEQVLAMRPTIVVARVLASRFDGASYDLDVETVVAGPARVGHWSFGPKSDPRPFHPCAQFIPNGQRALIVIWRPGTDLNLYNWWPIPADETMVVFGNQTATTLDGLVAELRAVAPATNTGSEPIHHSDFSPFAALIVGVLAFIVMVARPLWRPNRLIQSSDLPSDAHSVTLTDATLIEHA